VRNRALAQGYFHHRTRAIPWLCDAPRYSADFTETHADFSISVADRHQAVNETGGRLDHFGDAVDMDYFFLKL